MYDDFVTDGSGSGSEEDPVAKKSSKKSTKYSKDDSWGSEDPTESDESFGRKKKKAKPKPKPKRAPAKKKPAKKKPVKKKKYGSDDDSEDSDFETYSRKRAVLGKKPKEGEEAPPKPEVERKTRGVVINTTFNDEDWRGGKEYSDDDSF